MKNKNEVVVLTTLFELEWSMACDFFNSLNMQEVKEFDIFVVNDGFEQLEKIREIFPELTIIEVAGVNSIPQNREMLVRHAIDHYKKAVFCDFDDYFSTNRIGLSIDKLKQCDIIFNDVSLIRNNKLTQQNRFSNDLSEGHYVSINDIIQKNYLGFSNTAVNVNILNKLDFSFDESLIAVDWYFFSILMLNGCIADFTNRAITYYRQHDNNTADIESVNSSQIINELNVKRTHYIQMSKIDRLFLPYLKAVEALSGEFILGANNLDNHEELIFKKECQAWWSLIQLNVGKY